MQPAEKGDISDFSKSINWILWAGIFVPLVVSYFGKINHIKIGLIFMHLRMLHIFAIYDDIL